MGGQLSGTHVSVVDTPFLLLACLTITDVHDLLVV